jgi:hypothetical protein
MEGIVLALSNNVNIFNTKDICEMVFIIAGTLFCEAAMLCARRH